MFAVAPGLVDTMAENLNTTPPDIYTPGPLISMLILVEAAVAVATLLPVWQDGRIDTAQALGEEIEVVGEDGGQ
jgi:hypothetical protein